MRHWLVFIVLFCGYQSDELLAQQSNALKVIWSPSYLSNQGKLQLGTPWNRLSLAYRFGDGKYRHEVELLPLTIINEDNNGYHDASGMVIGEYKEKRFSIESSYSLIRQWSISPSLLFSTALSQAVGYHYRQTSPDLPGGIFGYKNTYQALWTATSLVPGQYYQMSPRFGFELNIPVEVIRFGVYRNKSDNPILSLRQQEITYFDFDLLDQIRTIRFRIGLAYQL